MRKPRPQSVSKSGSAQWTRCISRERRGLENLRAALVEQPELPGREPGQVVGGGREPGRGRDRRGPRRTGSGRALALPVARAVARGERWPRSASGISGVVLESASGSRMLAADVGGVGLARPRRHDLAGQRDARGSSTGTRWLGRVERFLVREPSAMIVLARREREVRRRPVGVLGLPRQARRVREQALDRDVALALRRASGRTRAGACRTGSSSRSFPASRCCSTATLVKSFEIEQML